MIPDGTRLLFDVYQGIKWLKDIRIFVGELLISAEKPFEGTAALWQHTVWVHCFFETNRNGDFFLW